MPIIDSIRVSGTTYQLQGGSGGSPTVELTQAEYDALVSAGTVSADTYYIITDATPVDMSNYYTSAQTDSAIASAVSGKVNISDNIVSAYTINGVYKYGSEGYPYNDKGIKITEFYCKQNNTSDISGAYAWGSMSITNGSSYNYIYCGVNASDGVITNVTYVEGSFNWDITNDGRLKVTLSDGWYVYQLNPQWNFDIYYPVIEIASGQTADVINNDLLDIVNETYQNMPNKYLTSKGSFSVGSEYVNLYLYDNKNNSYTKSFALGNGLKGSDDRINVVFSAQTAADKVLNTGNYNYCQVPSSSPSYNNAFDTLSIVFNSEYTGGTTYFTIRVGAISTNGSTSTNRYQYTVASNSLVFLGGVNARITFVQDTTNPYKYTFSIGDDYKSEWKVRYIQENEYCSIAGYDSTSKDNYIITAVTTPSFEQYGQDIIDDIYDKLDDKQDALSNASVLSGISSSDISNWNGKQDALVAGDNITISGNVISAVGGGSVTVDPSLDSGSTNPVANSAITNALDDKLDTSAYTPSVTYSAGRNISLANNTISLTLPVGELVTNKEIVSIFGYTYGTGSTTNSNTASTSSFQNLFVGNYNKTVGGTSTYSFYGNNIFGNNNVMSGTSFMTYDVGYNTIIGRNNTLRGASLSDSYSIGRYNTGNTSSELICGWYNIGNNPYETSFGRYNVSNTGSTTFGHSGNTLFSVGNGTTTSARHNAFEIRQNGDIYCSDGTNDVKLQDTITQTAANTTALGGLSLVKLTQAEYDALTTKDSNTLYIIIEN